MTHSDCQVTKYHSLRPTEFPDLDKLEFCQLVPPQVQRAELLISLRLRPRAEADSRRLCLRFRGVTDLRVHQTTSLITIPLLEVVCIADRHWEGVHYRVQDTEFDTISFYCTDLEARVEAP